MVNVSVLLRDYTSSGCGNTMRICPSANKAVLVSNLFLSIALNKNLLCINNFNFATIQVNVFVNTYNFPSSGIY